SECLMTAISPAWRRLVRSFVRRSSRAGAGPDRVGAAGVSRCLRTFMVGPLSHVPVGACVLDLACRVEQLRGVGLRRGGFVQDRKSTRLNSSHVSISYAVFCLKK